MKPTEQTLVEQMRITELEIAQRKELFRLTQQDINALMACRPLIEDKIEEIVDEFYEKQTSINEISLLIGDFDTLNRLRSAQRTYILDLFSGFYDVEYINHRLRIGLVHKRIGVEPKLYLSAVRDLKEILIRTLNLVFKDKVELQKTLEALDKLMYFDITLVFDTYIRSMLTEIETARSGLASYAKTLEEKVSERTKQLEELSRKDNLTGLFNIRAMEEALRRDLKYGQRNSLPLSLVYFDVDQFKQINDKEGHQRGDEILKTIGKVLIGISREVDTPCRYGGDEFCVILPGAIAEEAKMYCKRLLRTLEKEEPDLSLSIGVVQTGPEEYLIAHELVKSADDKMYEAKTQKGSYIAIEVVNESTPAVQAVVNS